MTTTTMKKLSKPEPVRDRGVATVELERGVKTTLRHLRALKAEQAILAEKIKKAESKIKEAMGDAEIATAGGKQVATYRRSIRSTLSQTLVKKLYPNVVEECTEEREVRTFKLLDDA
jgi:predicted phage-related endonuclease